MTLESYCAASGALGGAKFLCAGSMSPTNMLTGKILPGVPQGVRAEARHRGQRGRHGAKVVSSCWAWITLPYGIERATNDYLTIINNIVSKNPDVQIVIQSVTPMTETSTSTSEKLNNDQINAFNAKMQEYCQENRWYYLNVAEVFKDENGYLKLEYCK